MKSFYQWLESTGITVYHGSDKSFEKFDPKLIGSRTDPGFAGRGCYTTTDPAQASRWGKHVMQTTINGGNWLKINGPTDLYKMGLLRDMTPEELDSPNKKEIYKQLINDLTDGLIKQGYDGVEWTMSSGIKQFVLFHPENYEFISAK